MAGRSEPAIQAATGWPAWERSRPEWRTKPLPGWECPLDHLAHEPPKVPKLLRAYLNLGAKICGPPALDRHFKTIDFLTWLDLQALPAAVRTRYGN